MTFKVFMTAILTHLMGFVINIFKTPETIMTSIIGHILQPQKLIAVAVMAVFAYDLSRGGTGGQMTFIIGTFERVIAALIKGDWHIIAVGTIIIIPICMLINRK